jgi:hypothetical protein
MNSKQSSSTRGKTRGAILAALVLVFALLLSSTVTVDAQQNTNPFSSYNFVGGGLVGEVSNNPTTLQFGPDDRLYVGQKDGTIYAYTIQRNGPADYQVTATETITDVKNIPNHNDDGTSASQNNRQITGLYVTGTAANPVLYVTSSDPRIGAGGGGNDLGLDTNSGVVSRLTWTGSDWDKVDLVRGLPRSEENHATNGMQLDAAQNILYLAVGGHTNAGAPSNNFALTTEYYYSAAILSIDLDMLESMSIKTDNGNKYVYDLPTLDDPTRPNVSTVDGYVDQGDPFGGNDGLNQAKYDANGPVQIFSPGWRNLYDLVIMENGRMYGVDNGANGGWGGHPIDEADYPVDTNGGQPGNPNIPGECTHDYDPAEPGSVNVNGTSQGVGPGNDNKVNNKNGLHYIRPLEPGDDNYVAADDGHPVRGQYYAGHPAPVRGNPDGAGLYLNGTWLQPGNPNLPVDWPPVPFANPVECDFRNSGETDNTIANFGPSTNGITEYTASNYNGDLKGRLLMAGFNGSAPIYEAILSADGKTAVNCPADPGSNNCVATAFAGFGSQPLDITSQGDLDIFPGTVWTAVYGPDTIYIHEPGDYDGGGQSCTPDPTNDNVDNDSDGYTDYDEDQNGTSLCSAGSQPDDLDNIIEFNGFKRSDLLDLDDDNDGVPDVNDAFARDFQNGFGSMSQVPLELNLFNQGNLGLGDVGFTGLMTNGSTDYLDQFIGDPNDPDRIIFGGAVGVATVTTTDGDAYQGGNSQDNGFQFGVDVSTATGPYAVRSQINPPFFDGNAPGNYASHGIFLGSGDQENYIKLVLSKGSGDATVSGFEFLMEVAGSATSQKVDVPGVLNVTVIELIMKVNPANGEVTAFYSLDGTTPVQIGNPFTASGNLLAAIQGTYTIPGTSTPSALAVGMISTATGPAPVFKASWDYFEVNPVGPPTVTNPIGDINVVVGGSVNSIDLNTVFDDDSQLTFTASSSNNSIVSTNILDDNLALTIGQVGTATVTVTATDADNLSVSDDFTVTVTDQPLFELRINGGGAEITDYQGNTWVADSQFNPGGKAYLAKVGVVDVINVENPVAGTTSEIVYESERSGSSGWTYEIPVPNGTYDIDFHFAEIYFGSATAPTGPAGPGKRIFDIAIEGFTPAALDEYDISQAVIDNYSPTINATGADFAIVETITGIVVTDGSLTIAGTATKNQPKVSGMYIYTSTGGTGQNPINLAAIPDQTNYEGEEATFDVSATGGDGNLNYSISGQPAGIDVEPTNGDITGTIATGAAANSPYTVTVTVNDSDGDNSDIETETFTWTVLEPLNGTVLYRVNNGGPLVQDPAGDWTEDQSVSNADGTAQPGIPSPYLDLSSPSAQDKTSGVNFTGTNNLSNVPATLFNTERFSSASNPNNMQWNFPVTNGNYVVNLYFAETWTGAQNPGARIFDVEIEGIVELDNFDIVAVYGWQTTGLQSIPVTVADGNLDIDFIKGVQNPAVKAIEVIQLDENTNVPPQIAFNPTTIIPVKAGNEVAFDVTVSDFNGDTIDPVTIEVKDSNNVVVPNTAYTFEETATNAYAFSWSTSVGDTGSYTAMVTASDGMANASASIDFIIDPPPGPGSILYRVNTGGPQLAAADGSSPAWSADTGSSPSPFLVAGSASGQTSNGNAGNSHPGPIITTDPSLSGITGAPVDMFNTERYDSGSAPEMLWQFPVAPGTEVEVRLYFAELFINIDTAGERVFDVSVEGSVPAEFDDIDRLAIAGPKGAFVRTTTVTVIDGTLDLEFIHGVQNPAVQGIEIAVAGELDLTTITVEANPDTYGTAGVTFESGTGPYVPGTTVELLAIPDDTYDFVDWTIGGQSIGTDNPLIYTVPSDDVTIVANFIEVNPDVEIVSVTDYVNGQDVTGTEITDLSTQPIQLTANKVTFTWDTTGAGVYNGDHTHVSLNPPDPNAPAPANIYIGGQALDGSYTFEDLPLGIHTLRVEVAERQHSIYVDDQGSLVLAEVVVEVTNIPAETNPSALVQVNSGKGLNSSTYGKNSFKITNTGDVDITDISIDLSTGILPDIVFDPTGTAGDSTAKGLEADTGAIETGYVVPANNEVDPFSVPHQGDVLQGYDVMSMSFTDFGPGELFGASVDIDPTSIKGDTSSGDAGSVSGLELAGATVTVTFADGSTIVTNLFQEDGSLGGAQAVAALNAPAPTPVIEMVGVSTYSQVGAASQTINITGAPANTPIMLLQLDGRLYIDAGGNGYFDPDPFEANTVEAKVVYTATTDASGNASIPVTLLKTAPAEGPEAGLNHFMAAVDGPGDQTSRTSNIIVVEYDASAESAPTFVTVPDDQTDNVGETINLLGVVSATDLQNDPFTYSATDLPTGLSIDPTTGIISGTIAESACPATGGGDTVFVEENGSVWVEAESVANLNGWTEWSGNGGTGEDHPDAIGTYIEWPGAQYLGNNAAGNHGLLEYKVLINTTGVYQFKWRGNTGFIGGDLANGRNKSDHNDAWLKIEVTPDENFYGYRNSTGTTVYPNGSQALSDNPGSAPSGASGNGYFKVYRSGDQGFKWQSATNDHGGHGIYLNVETPGVYTIKIAARSNYFMIDRFGLSQTGGFTFNGGEGKPASPIQGGGTGSNSCDYNVTLNVTQDDNPSLFDTASFLWTVNNGSGSTNLPPVAVAQILPGTVLQDADENGGESVTFDGSGSFDSDGTVTDYKWFVNNSLVNTGQIIQTTLPVGTSTVSLQVTDDQGDINTTSVTVEVNAGSQQVDFGVTEIILWDADADQPLVSLSNTVPNVFTVDQFPASYSLEAIAVGDHDSLLFTGDVSATENFVPYALFGGSSTDYEGGTLGLGTYTFTATAYSGANGTGDAGVPMTVVITITDQISPLVANAGADQTIADGDNNGSEIITLDGTASSGNIVSYVWSDTNGQIATGATPQVQFQVGVYNLTLTVTDDQGATATDEVVITVTEGASQNTPPVANAGTDQTVTDGDNNGSEVVSLDGSASSDSDGNIVSYVWSDTNGQIATGVSPQVQFAVGTHNVTLTVTDDQGAAATDDMVITVNPGQTASNIQFTLLSINSGNATDVLTMSEGVVLTEAQATNMNIRAEVDNSVESAVFVLSGDANHTQLENNDPYALFSDGGSTNYYDDTLAPGNYQVTVTTYDDHDGTGNVLGTLTINFSVSDGNVGSGPGSGGSGGTGGSGGSGTNNQAPIADAGPDQEAVTDAIAQISLSAFNSGSVGYGDSYDPDGSIVTYDWFWTIDGTQYQAGGPYVTIDLPVSATPYDVTLTVTDNDGATDTDTVSVTVTGSNTGGGECNSSLVQEAESAALSGNFTLGNDNGVLYAHVPDGSGNEMDNPYNGHYVEFCFNVAQAGTYQIVATLNAHDAGSNSFYVHASGQAVTFRTNTNGSNFTQQVVKNDWDTEAWTFNLDAGDNIIRFALREHGTKLDKVELQAVSTNGGGGSDCSSSLVQQAETDAENNGFQVAGSYLFTWNNGNNAWYGAPPSDYTASGLPYAVFCFDVAPGNYDLYITMGASNGGNSNSFGIIGPGVSEVIQTSYNGQFNTEYVDWINVNGEFEIVVIQREDGAAIDKIELVPTN